ncbi:MAG: Cell division GTPase FtsZ3 [Candidatus Methanohalarchaeum thermophilum]|uniref:Cell division GTPase FtsZ3 n=1 Tax=Methanohalarchaeum thermophilum TaxID=1903181 RepID=A0A1Q6DSN3_METT1|nr:MAG: Cell division GTPase FtsZ3 [Candidatus Methanohalarchaeum thermophilum]
MALNVLLIGVGQCGNRILDEINKQAFGGGRLSKYFGRQKFPSNVKTVAINTSRNDLKELEYTKAKDRLHITHLHGVGANREEGKKVYEKNKDSIFKKLEEDDHYDLCFIISSTGGGTGSSFSPPLAQDLKEKYDFQVHSISVLPFRSEGTIFLQNTAFTLRELSDSGLDSIILVDNEFLRKGKDEDIHSAYSRINQMVAERMLFLLKALDSEMMLVTDLGDFKTVMDSGNMFATIGFCNAGENMRVESAIKKSLSPNGLLFDSNIFNEASRAMVTIQGEKDSLDMDGITRIIDKLSDEIGHVFKGVVVTDSNPRVLSVVSLDSSEELDDVFDKAVEAVEIEKKKKELQEENDEVFSKIDGMEPEY